jgi:hypothetical protein
MAATALPCCGRCKRKLTICMRTSLARGALPPPLGADGGAKQASQLQSGCMLFRGSAGASPYPCRALYLKVFGAVCYYSLRFVFKPETWFLLALDGTAAVSCNSQSALARLNSRLRAFHSFVRFGVSGVDGWVLLNEMAANPVRSGRKQPQLHCLVCCRSAWPELTAPRPFWVDCSMTGARALFWSLTGGR